MLGPLASNKANYMPLAQLPTVDVEKESVPTHQSFLSRHLVLLCLILVIGLQSMGLYGLYMRLTTYTRGQIESPVPELSIMVKSFERGPLYFNRSTPETDAAWASLAGLGSGFVNIPEYAEYGLKKGAVVGDRVIYGLSMFHQLHCLAAVRSMLWDLAEGRVDAKELFRSTPSDVSSNFEGGIKHGFWEVQHCMDYLRQGIQCAGDMTLEWPIYADGKTLFVGWEAPHQCRDHDAALAFAEGHR